MVRIVCVCAVGGDIKTLACKFQLSDTSPYIIPTRKKIVLKINSSPEWRRVLRPPSDDGTLLLTQTQPVIISFATLQISFNPQGNRLLTGSSDKTARIWDVQTGQCLQVLEGHTDEIFSCAFNYRGNIVITGMEGIHTKHLPGFPLNLATRFLEGCWKEFTVGLSSAFHGAWLILKYHFATVIAFILFGIFFFKMCFETGSWYVSLGGLTLLCSTDWPQTCSSSSAVASQW